MKGKYWPFVKCLFYLMFKRSSFRDVLKEKLSGSEMVYDLAKLAEEKKYRVFLLGGFDFGKGSTGELAARELKKLYPSLNIVGTYAGSPNPEEEKEIVKIINKVKPHLLFVAYGPVKQEKWVRRNIKNLKAVSFCLGGTFDFVSKEKKKVPKFFSDRGLEGVLRPFISERGNVKLMFRRMKRSWLGIIKFLILLKKEKKN